MATPRFKQSEWRGIFNTLEKSLENCRSEFKIALTEHESRTDMSSRVQNLEAETKALKAAGELLLNMINSSDNENKKDHDTLVAELKTLNQKIDVLSGEIGREIKEGLKGLGVEMEVRGDGFMDEIKRLDYENRLMEPNYDGLLEIMKARQTAVSEAIKTVVPAETKSVPAVPPIATPPKAKQGRWSWLYNKLFVEGRDWQPEEKTPYWFYTDYKPGN